MPNKTFGPMVRVLDDDEYALLSQDDVQGGLHSVEKTEDLYKLRSNIIKRGMHVFVAQDERTHVALADNDPNQWIIKDETLSVNGAEPDKAGNVEVSNFDAISVERVTIRGSGISHAKDQYTNTNLISNNYMGRGVLIGSGGEDAAILVRDEARLITVTPKRVEYRPKITVPAHINSVDKGKGVHEISFSYIFDKSILLDSIMIWPETDTSKAMIRITNSFGDVLAKTAPLSAYEKGDVDGLMNVVALGSDGQAFSFIEEMITFEASPLIITIVANKPFSVLGGKSDIYGDNHVEMGFFGSDITHSNIENQYSKYRGAIDHTPTILANEAIDYVLNSKEPLHYPLGESSGTISEGTEFTHEFNFEDDPNFKGMALKSLSIKTDVIPLGLFFDVVMLLPEGAKQYYTFPLTDNVQGEGGLYTITGHLSRPVFLPANTNISISVRQLDDAQFRAEQDAGGNTIVHLIGNELIYLTVTEDSMKSITSVECDRDANGRYMQFQYDNGTESGRISVESWFL